MSRSFAMTACLDLDLNLVAGTPGNEYLCGSLNKPAEPPASVHALGFAGGSPARAIPRAGREIDHTTNVVDLEVRNSITCHGSHSRGAVGKGTSQAAPQAACL
jgi:hypothetical protein